MSPAHQRFDVILVGAAERHLGLVDQRQLVVVDRLAQIGHQRQAIAAVLVVMVVPHCHTQVLALGDIHRDVCAAEQRCAFAAMGGKRGDADARAHVDQMAI